MKDLMLIYHIVFLVIFILTAITALGSILKWGLFRNVTPGYTRLLFSSLILEVVTAVLTVFITPPGVSNQRYIFKMEYVNYLPDLREQFSDNIQACIDDYIKTGMFPNRKPCNQNGSKTRVCSYIRSDVLLNHNSRIGQGIMYLTKETVTAQHDGLLGYKFPGANDATLIEVSSNLIGEQKDIKTSSENILNLRFDQQDNLVEVRKEGSIDKELTKYCAQRVHQPFDIKFVRNGSGTYIGELKPIKNGDKEVLFGRATLSLRSI